MSPYCLRIFHNKGKIYETHIADCVIHKPQVICLPDPKDDKTNHVTFRNIFKTFPVQFCLYLDFECFLSESDGSLKNVQQIHEVSGFCILRVSTEPSWNKCKPFLYSGGNVMDVFYKYLEQEQEEVDFYLRTNLHMEPLTAVEQKIHDKATECQQCYKPFDDTRSLRKTRHHLHLTGNYEKTIRNSCNLQLKPRIRKMYRRKYFFDGEKDNQGGKIGDESKQRNRKRRRGGSHSRNRGKKPGSSGRRCQPCKNDDDDDTDEDDFDFKRNSTATSKGHFFYSCDRA